MKSEEGLAPGVAVWANTTSGEPVLCAVLHADDVVPGEWLLSSPAHGHAIQRHFSEIELDDDKFAIPGGRVVIGGSREELRAEAARRGLEIRGPIRLEISKICGQKVEHFEAQCFPILKKDLKTA